MAIKQKAGAGQAERTSQPSNLVSLKPSDQTAGGMLDDVDVTFTECSFVEYDYNGKADKPTLALKVMMNDGENDHEQYFSAGDLERFQPSEDGKGIVAVSGAKGLSSTSNCAIFLKSIVDVGFPEDKLTGRVDVFENMNAHLVRIPQPKRKGLQQSDDRERTVLTVVKINRMPWEKSGGAKAATAAGNKAPAPKTQTAAPVEAEANGDASEKAVEVLLNILQAKNGSVLKTAIPGAAFKHLVGVKNRGEVLQYLADEDFLGTPDMGWEYDGKTVSAAS